MSLRLNGGYTLGCSRFEIRRSRYKLWLSKEARVKIRTARARVSFGLIVIANILGGIGSANSQALSLPIKVGTYAPGTPAEVARLGRDCDGPDNLVWSGRGFSADYIYMDNIVDIAKQPSGAYHLTSKTRVNDENTQQSGRVWQADVVVVGPGEFSFRQYAAHQPATSDPYRHFSFCHK
jgi:hypothetical protein